MTSQFGLRIEYLIPNDNFLPMVLLRSNLRGKPSFVSGFSIPLNENSEVAYFLWGTLYCHHTSHLGDIKLSCDICFYPDDI